MEDEDKDEGRNQRRRGEGGVNGRRESWRGEETVMGGVGESVRSAVNKMEGKGRNRKEYEKEGKGMAGGGRIIE